MQHFELFPLQVLPCLLSARRGLVERMLEPLSSHPAGGTAPCSSLNADPALPRHSLPSWTATEQAREASPRFWNSFLDIQTSRKRILDNRYCSKKYKGFCLWKTSHWFISSLVHHARFKIPVFLLVASLAKLGSSFFHSVRFSADTFCKARIFFFIPLLWLA